MSFRHVFRIVSIMMLLMSVGVTTTFAQTKSFRINSVDFSQFPKMRAYYEAEEVSPDGKERKPLEGLTNADFTLAETINGRGTKNYSVNAFTQQCSIKKEATPIRVVLVIDNSNSMLEKAGTTNQTRMEIVKEGAVAFVKEVDFVDPTAVAVLSFASDARLRQPFTNDVNSLVNAINNIEPSGYTNYEKPLLDPQIGAIKLLRETLGPPDVRRVIIFLTDGNPSEGDLNTGGSKASAVIKSITDQLNDNSITFFAVTAFIPMNPTLDIWARATGGRSFEVRSDNPKSEMEDIYRLIASLLSKKATCWLEWTSEFGCNQDNRKRSYKVTIPKENLSDDISLTLPDTSIASVSLSKSGVSFGNPPPNGTQQQSVILTAEKSDAFISNPVFANTPCGTYRIVSPSLPILIPKGTSVPFVIEFKQGANQVYCPSSLQLSGSPCSPPLISLFGGVNSIQLIEPSPSVSSVFSSCQDINITWEGVTPISESIKIEYSSNNGQSWNTITNNATNGSYLWKSEELKLLPKDGQFKLRLTEAQSSEYLWATSAGGTSQDSIFTIAIGSNNDDLFVAGAHRGTIRFGNGFNLTSPHADFSGFVAKYGAFSGSVAWATPMTSTKMLKAYSATTNNKAGTNQKVYATGFFTGDGQFGSQVRNQSNNKDRMSMFLVVLNSVGDILTVTDLGSRATASGEMIGTGVAFDPKTNKVFVRGIGRGKIAYQNFGDKIFDFFIPVNSNTWAEFTAEFSEDGVLQDIRQGVPSALRKLWPEKSIETSNATYSVDTYTGTRKFTGIADLTSAGSTDGFIAKFGIVQGSTSLSAVPFNISVAKFEMLDKSPIFQLGQVAVGNILNAIIGNDKGLINAGNIPTKILSVLNSNHDEFKFLEELAGFELEGNSKQSISLEISAFPKQTGQRCADITIFGECSDPITFRVCVDGLPPCNNFTLKDTVFDNTILNVKNTKSFVRVYENQTSSVRKMRLFLRDNINNSFTLKSIRVGTVPVNVTGNSIDINISPFEKVDADIEFTPKTTGVDCVKLMYATTNPNIICDTTYTQICGEGIAPLDGRIDNQSWDCQRPNTRLTKNVTFTNIGQIPIKINAASVSSGRFALTSTPPYPIVVANGGTLDFQVEYFPDAPTTHTASLTIEASDENNVTQITRRATLTGNGCEPKITLERECFPTVIIGKSDNKQNAVTIKNDGNLDMNVTNITVNPNTEFALITAFSPFTLAPNNSRTIPMQFTPAGIGARTATVTVTSDATETSKTIDVCGTGLPEGSVIQMGSIYVCDTKVNPTFEFPTTANPNEDITVTADIINGDQGSFIIEPASQVIPRNTKGTWKITFVPQATGTLATTLRFTTQGLGETQYALTGVAASTSLKLAISPDKIEQIKIGAPQTFTFAVEAGANISSLNIEDITVTLNYEPTMFNYKPNSLTSLSNGVVWETPTENKSNGVLSIKGKGVLPSPGNQNIFSLALDVLLGKSLAGTITSAITFPTKYAACLTPVTGSQATYKSEEVCFAQGRLVTPGTSITAPQIFPNPTFSTARIDFTVGIDAPTSIVIVNQLGETVMTVIDSKLEKGNYSSVLDLSAVSNGLYHIIYTCGPYSFTQVMNVAK